MGSHKFEFARKSPFVSSYVFDLLLSSTKLCNSCRQQGTVVKNGRFASQVLAGLGHKGIIHSHS